MVSEANVAGEVSAAFAQVVGKHQRWAIAKIEGSEVVLQAVSEGRDANLESLVDQLGNEPCYIVYDFEATRADTSTLCKTVFISYAPDSCTDMQKRFAIQNYKASVRAKIQTSKEMQINDKADLTENEFRDAFSLNN